MKRNRYNILLAGVIVTLSLAAAGNAAAQTIATAAGNYSLGSGYTGDGGTATTARLSNPNGVVKDAAGNLYIAEWGNNVIRKVTPSGTISTFAGNGTAGYSGDGGAATAAKLDGPRRMAIDASGNLYVSDYNNHVIRKITSAGIISTFAGNGSSGTAGDGGAATAAQLDHCVGICLDTAGNLYIADSWSHRVRKVSTSGIISTVAGTMSSGYSGDGGAATAATLNFPHDVAVTRDGKLYIADYNNYVIREVNMSTGNIATIAGDNTYGYSGDGGAPIFAHLSHPIGLAIDPTQTKLFISDLDNFRVRIVTLPPNIGTYAGTGTGGYSGDGGMANAAKIQQTQGLFCDATGKLYIADNWNNVVRVVTPASIAITGSTSVCVGSTTTLSTTSSSVTWATSNPAIATVSSTGVVTGVSAGTCTIYCSDAPGSLGWVTITVGSAPAAITGTTTLCEGGITTLSNTTPGGTWSSGSTGIATAAAGTGIISGVAGGTATISYTVSGCSVTTVVTVNPLPAAGTVTGTNNVCVAATVTLSNSVAGGTWSSSSTAIATVSSGGVVTGVAAGTVTISYTTTNSCGSSNALMVVTVNACTTAIGNTITGLPVSVFPNPVSDHCTIQLPQFTGTATIALLDITGRQVKHTMLEGSNAAELNVSDIQPGNYIVVVTTNGGMYRIRLTVAK